MGRYGKCRKFELDIPEWERDVGFDPTSVLDKCPRKETWVNWQGREVLPSPLAPRAEMVASDDTIPFDLDFLPLRDPLNFVAGGLGEHYVAWEQIQAPPQVLGWVKSGVEVEDFFRHFKGDFKGESYDSDKPPFRVFSNSSACAGFVEFITTTLLDRVENGSLQVWGKVGECMPPRLVMPLTVEPTKPRLCHDERFLNLWIVDSPFSLDTLKDVPRLVTKDMFMTSIDDKSGYDHVHLSRESRPYFGVI